MEKQITYYKCEYENLRRKKNKEIERLKNQQTLFFDKTYKLLKMIGLTDREILEYYGGKK